MTPVSALASGRRRGKLDSMLPSLMAELVQLVEEALHAAEPPIDLSALRGLSFAGDCASVAISGMACTPKGNRALLVCLRRTAGAIAPELIINGRLMPYTRSTRPQIVRELAARLSASPAPRRAGYGETGSPYR